MVYVLKGHLDTISGLRLSPDGSYLLSNGMDNTSKLIVNSVPNGWGVMLIIFISFFSQTVGCKTICTGESSREKF